MSANDTNGDAESLPRSVPEYLLQGWQAAIDSVTEILDVPVALVMRVVGPRIEVFVCSNTPTNPYKSGDSELLPASGLYCEAVVLAREHGLLSYLGFPIILPDGRVFGTVCVLDRQPRNYSGSQRRLLANVGKLLEDQLSMVPRDWGAAHSHASTVLEMRVIERTQQLRRSTELLQAVMDGATDAIFLKDTSGTFLIFNRAAATFIGRPAADVIGRKTEDVFPAATSREIRAHELAVIRTGVATTVEETIIANGQIRTFLTTRSAQRDENGRITGLIGIARNITAMKQAEQARKRAEEDLKRSYEALRQAAEALSIARDEAQSAERAKGDFLAAMSHEIRTPMNTVIGMTRLTLNTELSGRQRNYLEKIDSAAGSLLNIINDVLDFSKIEAGGLTLEETDFHLDTVLDSVTNVTAMGAEEKGLEMIYAVADDVPRNLRGDPLRLGQVLINLLSNAVKFTHSGEVLVTISNTAQSAGRVTLQFSVKDTGIGLERGQIDGLFRAFTQLGPHISRKYGGTGLGLAISRQLAELMGGKIWAEGEPGIGSTFHFTIDVALPRDSHSVAPAEPRRLPVPRRALIADDNSLSREILADILRSVGTEPTTVDSGTAALAEFKAAAQAGRDYGLVLMDWHMPGIDGLETVTRLRADCELTRMPAVLMVTAFGREEIHQSAEQLGVAGVLIKPVTRSMMFNTLSKIFGEDPSSGGDGRRAGTTTVGRGLRIPAKAAARLANHTVLVVDDNALNQEVVTDMLLAVQVKVYRASDGLEAIRKLGERHYDVVLMDVHMPGMDGLTASRQIRAQPRFAHLPIIALTAQVLVEERGATVAAGMNGHLTKPIDEALLYQALLDVLEESSARDYSLARLGEDVPRLRLLLAGFLHDTADAPAKLNALVAAGELQQAASLVHFIRGAAFYMEATALCEVAGRFEIAARETDAPVARTTLDEFIALLAPLREYLTGRLQQLA
jgi:two-component system, sensor histidine kinase and response regulator